ncbi:hypothetical protein GQ457_07G000070 [Hibiscus cannabinus]
MFVVFLSTSFPTGSRTKGGPCDRHEGGEGGWSKWWFIGNVSWFFRHGVRRRVAWSRTSRRRWPPHGVAWLQTHGCKQDLGSRWGAATPVTLAGVTAPGWRVLRYGEEDEGSVGGGSSWGPYGGDHRPHGADGSRLMGRKQAPRGRLGADWPDGLGRRQVRGLRQGADRPDGLGRRQDRGSDGVLGQGPGARTGADWPDGLGRRQDRGLGQGADRPDGHGRRQDRGLGQGADRPDGHGRRQDRGLGQGADWPDGPVVGRTGGSDRVRTGRTVSVVGRTGGSDRVRTGRTVSGVGRTEGSDRVQTGRTVSDAGRTRGSDRGRSPRSSSTALRTLGGGLLGGSDPPPHRPPSGGAGPRSRGGPRKAPMRQRCGPVVPRWRPIVPTRCSERWGTAADQLSDEGGCSLFGSPHLGAAEPSFLERFCGTWVGLVGFQWWSDHSTTVAAAGHGGRNFSDVGISYGFESPPLGAIELSFLGRIRGTWGGLMGGKMWDVHRTMVVPSGHGGLMIYLVGNLDKLVNRRAWTQGTTSRRWCRPKCGSKTKRWGARFTLLGRCGIQWDHGCGADRPSLGKRRPVGSRGLHATLVAGNMGKERLCVLDLDDASHLPMRCTWGGLWILIWWCGSKTKRWGVCFTLLGHCGILWDRGCGVDRPSSGKRRPVGSRGLHTTLGAGNMGKERHCVLDLDDAPHLPMRCTWGGMWNLIWWLCDMVALWHSWSKTRRRWFMGGSLRVAIGWHWRRCLFEPVSPTRWCRSNPGSKTKSGGCKVSFTPLGPCGSLRDRGCDVYHPYSGKLRPWCSCSYSATLCAGKMVEPWPLVWNRDTWSGFGCRTRVNDVGHCGLKGDRGCTAYDPDLAKYGTQRAIGCSTNLGTGKLIMCSPLGCSHVTGNEIEAQDPSSGYGKLCDGACLGGKDLNYLIDSTEPPLGYSMPCNESDWMGGCRVLFTESGSYKTAQDGCGWVDFLGLDKGGLQQDRGCCTVLTILGWLYWCQQSCPLSGPLVGLETPPRGTKRKWCMHGFICGCSRVPSIVDGLGDNSTLRSRVKSGHARGLGNVLCSTVQLLQQPLGFDTVQDFLGLGKGCGKDMIGNSSSGLSLIFTKTSNCGFDYFCMWKTVLLDRVVTDFPSEKKGCWAFNVKVGLSHMVGKMDKKPKGTTFVISLASAFSWSQGVGGKEVSIALLLSFLLAEPILFVSLMEDSSKILVQEMEGLRFTEDELQVVEEIEALGLEPVQGEERWVVGKLVSPRIVDGPLLIRIYFSVWKNQPLEEATSLGPNMFLFKFKKDEDRDFVLGRCPWTFDGELLALKPFDKLLSPKDYDFHPLPIWMRIYDVPLGFMSSKVGEAVGNKFGKCIATDLRDEKGCSGEYLRVRVEIDSSRPLKRCTVLGKNAKTGQPRVCMVKYERLPRFCFYCGIIGHEFQLCPDLPKGDTPTFQFGDWLRVEPLKSNDLAKRKVRPGIVYAPKLEESGSKQNQKGTTLEAKGESETKLVEMGDGSGSNKVVIEGNDKSLTVGPNQSGQPITPRPKHKNAKRALKEKIEENGSKKSKKANHDFIKLCLDLLKGRASMVDVNQTVIVLIPKIDSPTLMKHFRPISLCTVVYKTCSKVLVNRMKPLMSCCIAENQSAFVPGRLISDNVIVANELFHYLNGSKNGPNKGAAIKLDMEKAYDRVEWHFLSDVMKKMGFADGWINSIMMCVTTVSFCLKINGEISDFFRPSRGLRQGDPLSPYLFLFCTQGLSAMLLKDQREGRIRGVRASQKGPRINHLLYADDCLLFIKNSEKEARRLKEVLTVYEASSGQKINVEKSSIYFSNGTSEQSKTALKSILNMNEDAVLGQYLGLPLIVGKSKMEAFKFLIENVDKRSGNWSKNLLSFGGREIFIKSVAQGIPAYAMCCFMLPDCILEPIVSTTRNFWWSGRHNERGCKASVETAVQQGVLVF